MNNYSDFLKLTHVFILITTLDFLFLLTVIPTGVNLIVCRGCLRDDLHNPVLD